MTTWRDWLGVVSTILSILGFSGVLIGVGAFIKNLQKEAAERDVGRVCCDKKKMGYFAINKPWIFQLWKNVERPRVPKISAFIEAGDDLVFTSALFDSIPAQYDEVCWRGIYEAFFNEIAWTKDPILYDTLEPKLRQYVQRGKDRVKELRDKIKSVDTELAKDIASVHPIRGSDPEPDLEKHAPVDKGAKDKTDLVKLTLGEAYRDRHLLYDRQYQKGPYLVNCVRPLDGKPSQSPFDNPQPLWIYDKKPCIDTSISESTALAFVLGMQLKKQDKTITGYGAFGMSLSCEKYGPFGRLHLAYSSDTGDILDKPMGSGYSTLLAKHLACGALPSAQETMKNGGGGRTMSLFMDRVHADALKLGKCLDFTPKGPISNTAIRTLSQMPSSTLPDIFSQAEAISQAEAKVDPAAFGVWRLGRGFNDYYCAVPSLALPLVVLSHNRHGTLWTP